MRIKFSSYFLLFLVLLGLFGIIESLTFDYPQAIVLPLALSSIIFILALMELIKEWQGQSGNQTTKNVEPPGDTKLKERRGVELLLGWVAGFSVGVYLLGFIIAFPIFTFSYLKLRGRGWTVAIIFAISALALMYLAFELGLKVQLYRGFIFGSR